MLLIIGEFRENRRKEGRKWNSIRLYRGILRYFESKQSLWAVILHQEAYRSETVYRHSMRIHC